MPQSACAVFISSFSCIWFRCICESVKCVCWSISVCLFVDNQPKLKKVNHWKHFCRGIPCRGSSCAPWQPGKQHSASTWGPKLQETSWRVRPQFIMQHLALIWVDLTQPNLAQRFVTQMSLAKHHIVLCSYATLSRFITYSSKSSSNIN